MNGRKDVRCASHFCYDMLPNRPLYVFGRGRCPTKFSGTFIGGADKQWYAENSGTSHYVLRGDIAPVTINSVFRYGKMLGMERMTPTMPTVETTALQRTDRDEIHSKNNAPAAK